MTGPEWFAADVGTGERGSRDSGSGDPGPEDPGGRHQARTDQAPAGQGGADQAPADRGGADREGADQTGRDQESRRRPGADTSTPGSGRESEPDAPPPGGWFGLRVLPAGWMRGSLMTLTALATIVIALGDLASAWVVVVLPATVAALVAYHEVLERLIHPETAGPR